MQNFVNKQRLVNQFIELVKIDSETKHEEKISNHVKKIVSELGLQWKEDNAGALSGHGANNLFVHLPSNMPETTKLPKIFFCSHMDTVAPGKNIKPHIDDAGYIRSDGTTILGSDDKAGVSALIEAITVLQEHDLPHGDIQFIFTVGEENSVAGTQAIDEQMIQADYGFVLDGSGKVGNIITSCTGKAEVRIQFHGLASHAGLRPEDGVSAVLMASQALLSMPLGRIDHETTANVGSFMAEGATNVVRDYVEVIAEARSLDEKKLERQIKEMKQASEKAAAAMGGSIHFEADLSYPAFKLDVNHEVVQIANKAIQQIGRTPKLLSFNGGTDANRFNALGVTTVVLAAGYENNHTLKERIHIDELMNSTAMVLAIIGEVGRLD